MKKQLMIVVIIVILLTVGLSGCNQQQQSSTIATIGDIQGDVNKYLNQTVTVTASIYGSEITSTYMIMDSSYNSMYIAESNNTVKPTPVIAGLQYKFTGIVRYGQLPDSFFSDVVYLELTKIETT
ncbi:MAG: hypothetical protein MUO82_09405 [Candidatus Thermoplasmatota archaeon]|nr:hypothetical protein [Candidatus Thermoplasmatota archaeon]